MNKLLKAFVVLAAVTAWHQPVAAQPKITWDSRSLMVDGRRVVPVMGEIHYSRLPENEWVSAVRNMKAGGVTMIATYVFWNHVEEIEDQWDWSGQRNLRRFLEVCKAEQMPVVLRLGPFCHGEVRNGGIPDWFFAKGIKSRSEDPRFLALAEKLYRQIFTQVQGLQWKDGGPVVACQFDNEYRGKGSYLMALKKIARRVGFDLPFYTRTGWPELSTPVPYGEMLPLYGDYADGFWERSTKATAGSYYKAFFFKPQRDNQNIATEQIKYGTGTASAGKGQAEASYPYFTCELGGGMMTSYHRRVYMYPNDAYAMAVVKLGSGSNLLGYYMFHGGTNPEGKLTYLNETQRTLATNYNDLPVKTYDFQAPLGEFGQVNPVFFRLRPLHVFMHDFQEVLAPMDAHYPNGDKEIKKGDNSYLRWSYRSSVVSDTDDANRQKSSAFVFFNNYERLQSLTAKKNVQFNVGGVKFPARPMTIPEGAIGIFPVNVGGIKYATAQLVARRDGKVYLMQIKGIPVEIAFQGGKTIKNVRPRGTAKPVYKNYYLLTEDEAERLFLEGADCGSCDSSLAGSTACRHAQALAAFDLATARNQSVTFKKTKEAGPLRTITIGVNKVAEEPTDADFNSAAVYTIDIPVNSVADGRMGHLDKALLDIDYHGDCARLYADGKLLDDNFYNGRHFQYGLWRLPKSVAKLELRILPMQANEPVYFPAEADTRLGEGVNSIKIFY